MTTRRDVLKTTLAATVASLLSSGNASAQSNNGGLKVLILGGTGFIGPHLVRHALDRGHTLTLFNRGRTNAHLFPTVEKLVGDRNNDLKALAGKRWDAVIDNSGYTPAQVALSCDALKDSCDRYLFTSTRAVYTDYTADVMDENAPVGPKDLPESEWSGYGPDKVLAERVVEQTFGERSTIPRPPVIVGPGDRTDRFTYWVDRIDRGGDILVQGDWDDPVQFVDVRDLSEFYVHLLEQGTAGIFNTEGPGSPLTTAGLVHGIKAISAVPSQFHRMEWDFLLDQGETPQRSLAFWQPPRGRYLNYGRMDNSRAIDAGMTFRPLATTASDTLAWHKTRPATDRQTLRSGLSADREALLLKRWREQNAAL